MLPASSWPSSDRLKDGLEEMWNSRTWQRYVAEVFLACCPGIFYFFFSACAGACDPRHSQLLPTTGGGPMSPGPSLQTVSAAESTNEKGNGREDLKKKKKKKI